MTSIAKVMIFLKKTYSFPDANYEHYYNRLISDMICLIHSLGKNSLKGYYTTMRSLIENFVRVMLKYDDANATGIRNMFAELRNKMVVNSKEYMDYIEGEYGKCCDIVHSNKQANLPIYAYYEEIISRDEITEALKSDMLKNLITFYRKIKEFVIMNNSEMVNSAFQNKKELLSYLIGEKSYNEFEKQIF